MVENRPGAGGLVGLDSVAKATPDGHTMVMMETSSVLQKWLHKAVPFDVVTDFAPIAQTATTPLFLFANASLPVSNLQDLIAYAKANPGKLSVGTPGIGTPHHLAAAMLNAAAGVDITHVPYKGTAPALNDLLGGQIPLMWATPNVVLQYVEAGKISRSSLARFGRVSILPKCRPPTRVACRGSTSASGSASPLRRKRRMTSSSERAAHWPRSTSCRTSRRRRRRSVTI